MLERELKNKILQLVTEDLSYARDRVEAESMTYEYTSEVYSLVKLGIVREDFYYDIVGSIDSVIYELDLDYPWDLDECERGE